MDKTVTTSVRIPQKTRERLERKAKTLKRGKSWIINQALEQYLGTDGEDKLAREARRQSLLASGGLDEGEAWEKASDLEDWTA